MNGKYYNLVTVTANFSGLDRWFKIQTLVKYRKFQKKSQVMMVSSFKLKVHFRAPCQTQQKE